MRFWDPEADKRRMLAKKGAAKARQEQQEEGFDDRELKRRAKKYGRRLIQRRMPDRSN